MDKKRTGTSTRKPPEPSNSHAEIDDWMKGLMPDLQPIVARLDELIRETLPELQYAIKWKKAYYGLPDRGWVIEMVAYDVSVNVVFLGGVDFDSPPPLGDRDRSRYIKVRSLDEIDEDDLRTWTICATEPVNAPSCSQRDRSSWAHSSCQPRSRLSLLLSS